MQAIVVGGREEMWDSKASAEGISWMVDMFVLVCIWQAGGWGMSARVYGRFENESRIFEGIVMRFVTAMWGKEKRKQSALRLHDLILSAREIRSQV